MSRGAPHLSRHPIIFLVQILLHFAPLEYKRAKEGIAQISVSAKWLESEGNTQGIHTRAFQSNPFPVPKLKAKQTGKETTRSVRLHLVMIRSRLQESRPCCMHQDSMRN
jgi:hypothetical protein